MIPYVAYCADRRRRSGAQTSATEVERTLFAINRLGAGGCRSATTQKERETAHEVRGTSACADRSGA